MNALRALCRVQPFCFEANCAPVTVRLHFYNLCVWFTTAYYLSLLEPVIQKFQAVEPNLVTAKNQIQKVLKLHRANTDQYFHDDFYCEVLQLSEQLGISLIFPRQSLRSVYRLSTQAANLKDHYRQTLFIRYLDLLITSLNTRFSDDHSATSKLSFLISSRFAQLGKENFGKLFMKL